MQKVILITGVSTGFGNHTAKLLAQKGHNVYGTVRKEAEIDSSVTILKMDLTDADSIQSAVAKVMQAEGRIDVLINNAGMHTGGAIETTTIENAKKQMDTNVMGMVYMLREVLPVMRKQGQGTIINFSSIGGLMGLPFQGFYSASKFAIEGLSEALRMELKEFNINVIVINPGDFHTNNTQNRRNFLNSGVNDPYDTQFRKSLSIIEQDENKGWPPERLARKIVQIVDSKHPAPRYIFASFEQKLAVVIKKILPVNWFMSILGSHYGIK